MARKATVEDNEVLCGKVGGQSRHHQVLADLISGKRIMVEEMQKQQNVLMTRIDQQLEVVNQQQDTLNQLLASLVSRPKPNSCFRCGKDGHFIGNCLKPQLRGHETSTEDVGKRESLTAVSPAVEGTDSGSPLPKIVGGTPTTTAKLAGMEVECLINTGCMVTLVSETFYKQKLESECGGV